MFYIRQTHINGCGFACLKMILANLRKDKRYLFIPEKNEKASSYKDLIVEAKKYGLVLCGFRVNSKDEIFKHKQFPIIATLDLGEGQFHAVVVASINKKRVKLLDPDKGPLNMKVSEFLRLWDSTGLMVESDTNDGFAYGYEDLDRNKQQGWEAFLQAISGLFCILGVYFINKQNNIVLPVAFLTAFVISEIILKTLMFKDMSAIDNFYLSQFKIRKKDFRVFFERLEKFKELSIANPVNFASNLTICIFMCFIMIVNGLVNTIFVLIPLALSLLDVVFLEPAKRASSSEIEIDESQLSNAENQDDFVSKMNKVHKKAYHLGKDELAKKYLFVFILCVSALVVTAFTDQFNLTKVVFYIFSQVLLLDYFKKTLMFSEKEREFDVAKAKLYNTIHQNDEKN